MDVFDCALAECNHLFQQTICDMNSKLTVNLAGKSDVTPAVGGRRHFGSNHNTLIIYEIIK